MKKLSRKASRIFVLIPVAILLLGVFVWQNAKLTGAYVAKAPNAAILLQIVEGQDGKLEGQYQGIYLNDDGGIKSGAFTISGVADGWNISFSLKEMGFFPVAESSGRFNGMNLTLHFSGNNGAVETQKFSRSNVDDFQDWANQLRQKSQTILAAKAQKERELRSRAERQDFLVRISKLISQMQNMGVHIDATLKSLQQGNDRYRNITAKVEGYYQRAARVAGDAYSVPRNQIIVAMNQGVVATNQINSQIEAIRADYESRIEPLSGELKQIRQQCLSGYMSTGTECEGLEEAGKTYEHKAQDLFAALNQLDKTYQVELASQQAMIDKAEKVH